MDLNKFIRNENALDRHSYCFLYKIILTKKMSMASFTSDYSQELLYEKLNVFILCYFCENDMFWNYDNQNK